MNKIAEEKIRKAIVWGLAVLCFLAPIKFTHLVIFHHLTSWPKNGLEWILNAWPAAVFYGGCMVLFLISLLIGSWKNLQKYVWICPLLFLLSQCVSTLTSIDPPTSYPVIRLFFSLAVGYILGAQMLKDEQDLEWITFSWLASSFLVVASGIFQANGGLEDVKRLLHEHPELIKQNPMLSSWAWSPRIYATFISPNALGGYIISTIFVITVWGRLNQTKEFFVRLLISSLTIVALFYCLWQSQSKGSYIIFFITISLAIILTCYRKFFVFIFLIIVFFCAIMGVLFGYGQRRDYNEMPEAAIKIGKKSLEHRIGFWKAACQIGWERPLLGSGPGTFAKKYPLYKKSHDEDTRLVHNNYLQMWSDSGIGGFVTFILWLPGTLFLWLYHWWNKRPSKQITQTLLWCACLTFALHSLVDFDLYMISNSWPIFLLIGYLSTSIPEDRKITKQL